MNDTVNWGVLSTAKIGRQHVMPAIQASRNGEITAIAGRDGERTRAVADEFGIATAYDSYEALLEDPSIDAVYIPLPNHLHTEWTRRAAEAGKHVLCEKPMALTSSEAQEMVDACTDAGVLFMDAFMYRLHPTWQAVIDLVRGGRIGDVTSIQSWFSYFNDDPANIRNVAEYGGGALMDIGCYPINVSRLLFGGEPERVSASITRDPSSGVDIHTSAILEFAQGTSSFTCSTRCEPDQRVDIYGTTGRISVDIPFNIPPDRPTHVRVAAGGDPPVAPTVETLTFDPADQYRIEVEQFADAVLTRGEPPVPADDGVANMRVIEQVFAAANVTP